MEGGGGHMSFSWASFRAAGRRLSAVRYPPRLELMPGRRDHHVYCGLHAGACILMDCDCHKLWPSLRFKTGHAAHGGCDYQENVCGYNNILGDVHGTFVIVCRREPCIAQPSHCSIMFGDCHSVVRGDFPMAASSFGTLPSRHSVRLFNERQSPHHSQSKVVTVCRNFFGLRLLKHWKIRIAYRQWRSHKGMCTCIHRREPEWTQIQTWETTHRENGLNLKQGGVLHICF